jgi:hypothetical protein
MRGVGESQPAADRYRLLLGIDPRPSPKTTEPEKTASITANCIIRLANITVTTSIVIGDSATVSRHAAPSVVNCAKIYCEQLLESAVIFDRDLHHSVAHFTLIVMKCEICKRDFEAVRPDARYCGTNCRSTAYRSRLQTLARAGLRAQPASAEGEKVQRMGTDDEASAHRPVESVAGGHPDRQPPKGITSEPKEPVATWPSPPPAPAKPTAPPPSSDQSAAVRALADAIVEQKLGPLQQAIEELHKKAQAQTADHQAALKKEQKKRKKLRKKLESPWWAGGGHVPGWLVPVLAAGGGGLLVNLLTETDGKTIGAWLADVLSSTPQAPNAGGDAQASQPTVAQLIQEKFVMPMRAQWQANVQAQADRARQWRSRVDESGSPPSQESSQAADAVRSAPAPADGGQPASSSQKAAPEPSVAAPSYPEYCVPWMLPRDDAADLLTELTGAQRQQQGAFCSYKFDSKRPLVARLVASVEPSLVWQRKRGNAWYDAWLLYRAAMSLLQLVNRIEHAAKAQLPFKDKPVTATAVALMDAARELQERVRSHICGIQNRLKITSETPIELVHAATRVEWAVKRTRPAPDDLLACALHDAMVDLHSLILATHEDEQYQLSMCNQEAPVENSAIVENRHDVEVRSDEIEALRPTAWALQRYGPPPSKKLVPPPETPEVTADSSGQLAWDSWLKPTGPADADATGRTAQAVEKQSVADERMDAEPRQDSRASDHGEEMAQSVSNRQEYDDAKDADEASEIEFLSAANSETDAWGDSDDDDKPDVGDGSGDVADKSDDDPPNEDDDGSDDEQGDLLEKQSTDDDDPSADDLAVDAWDDDDQEVDEPER